jgi:hypothetical protein
MKPLNSISWQANPVIGVLCVQLYLICYANLIEMSLCKPFIVWHEGLQA